MPAALELPADPSFAALQAEHEGLLEFVYLCPVGLLQLDASGDVQMMNPLAAQLLMPIARAPMIRNLFELLGGTAPEIRNMAQAFEPPRGTICENHRIFVGPRDRGEPQVLACTLIKIEAGRLMAVLSDISKQVAQERRLKQTESWFSAILTGVNDFALLSLDGKGRVNSWNQSGVRLTGYAETEILGRTLNVFYFPEEAIQGRALEQIDLARRDGWHLDEGWRRRKDGSRYWCQSLVSALEEENGDVNGFSVVLRDVTERKVSGDELRRLLTTDHLTGVTNRARFYELAEAEEARWHRTRQRLSALMIDADYFKRINDGHGHAAGDAVLKELAGACQRLLRPTDTLARIGGEEFVILLPSLDIEGAAIVGERLRREIMDLVVPTGRTSVSFTISIGCASMGEGIDSIDKLVKAADEALYKAKQGGRNRVVAYEPGRAVA